jgi:putative serine protease PepD
MPSSRSSEIRRRSATLAAALVLGAGGGAGAALALDDSPRTVERAPGPAATTESAALQANGDLTVNQVYRRARGGVVDITVTNGQSKAAGSGFVIDTRGDIVTNEHVVSGGGSIEVEFAGGRKATARLVGEDASSDVAVIRVSVPASVLQPLTFADSSKVQVGDGVVAIGSPFGLSGTTTTGVVSALDRSISAPNRYTITGAIQTDAPINRGNSGGPLLDSHGRVIGVNSQIETNSGDSSGVGFAVSSNTARRVAEAVVSGGKVAHPYLGVSLADGNGGAAVSSVASGSPAAGVGLRPGDVVTALDGKRVESSDEAVAVIASHSPGDQLAIAFRRDGRSDQAHATLTERPS